MPASGRSDEEFVAEALELINPPSDNRDTTRNEVVDSIHNLRVIHRCEFFRQPSPGERKERLKTYLKNLQAAKRTIYRGFQTKDSDEFLRHLDAEIERIKPLYDYEVSKRGRRSKPRDATAALAASMAQGLISGRATLTAHGPWHRLSMLLYEAATGKSNCNKVLYYMTQYKNQNRKYVFVEPSETPDLVIIRPSKGARPSQGRRQQMYSIGPCLFPNDVKLSDIFDVPFERCSITRLDRSGGR
jgi:hypothetical protein